MTLLQRDRENIEIGREEGRAEGSTWTAKVLKLHTKGLPKEVIASQLNLDINYVKQIIHDFEND